MAYYISPEGQFSPDGIYTFEKQIHFSDVSSVQMKIFTTGRYILLINGEYICEGPCRSSENIRYYDTVTTDRFTNGLNTITVKIMHITKKQHFSTIFKSLRPVLLFEAHSDNFHLEADSDWECSYHKGHKLIYHNFLPPFIPPFESVNTGIKSENIKLESTFTDESLFNYGIIQEYNLQPRPIPMIYPSSEIEFKTVKKGQNFIELDAGKYTTAKIRITVAKNSNIKVIYSECYTKNGTKNKRDDISGQLSGVYDEIKTDDKEYNFSTFWFRAFRYIRIEAENIGNSLIQIKGYTYHYPLNITGNFRCSDENYNKMFEVSKNTLLCCMSDIFVDCPYWEQQQYIMDTAIESAVSLRLSSDTKLIKKSISELAASQTPDGYLCANYPCDYMQIIPGFTFFWIFLLKDYLDYSQDTAFITKHLPTMDKALQAFINRFNENGMITRSQWWDFVDNVPAWENCCPNVGHAEGITVYNLYFAAALNTAAHICEKLNLTAKSDFYSSFAEKVNEKIKEKCSDTKRGLLRDGCDTETFSIHTVMWAILAETFTHEKNNLLSHINDNDIQKCTFSMYYYLFRAFEKADNTGLIFSYMNEWQKMLDMNCSSWCENPTNPRSECHAWSCAPLHEFSSCILGVKISFDDEIIISPYTAHLTYAKGVVPTRSGDISVSWNISNNIFSIEISGVPKMKKKVILPDGQIFYFSEKTAVFTCKL